MTFKQGQTPWNKGLTKKTTTAIATRLLPHLVVKKETCRLFLEACDLMIKRKHLTKDGFLEIVSLRDKISKKMYTHDYTWWKRQLGDD